MGETQSTFAEDYKNEYRNENLSNTKLMSALQKGQTERVTKLLKDISGKKLHKRDERGDTALHKAAAMGNGEILQQLIAKGADLYCKNADGFTPFHLSVLYGKRKCAALLLEATTGAGPSTCSAASTNTNAAVSTSTSLFASLNNIVGVGGGGGGGSGGSDTKESAASNAPNSGSNPNDADGKKEDEVSMLDELFPYNPGVPLYTSTLDRRGVYTWTIRNFSKIEKKATSPPISIGGVFWRLICYPHGTKNDDNLSLFVEVANTNDLEEDWSYLTNFVFTIVSQSYPEKKIQREVTGHKFDQVHSDLGFPVMVKKQYLHDVKNAMLLYDQLIIEFNMEVIMNTNYSFDSMSSSITWKPHNISSVKDKIQSKEFELNTRRIVVYPSGKGTQKKANHDCMSMYLRVANSETLAYGWFHVVNFRFSLIDQLTGKKFQRQETKTFMQGVEDWGFPQFIKLATVFAPDSGYIVSDSLLVELQMEVIDRHRPSIQRVSGTYNDAYYAKMRKDMEDLRFSVLHWAVYMNVPSDCVDLLRYRAKHEVVDSSDRTPLDWAAASGDQSLVEVLLEFEGASLNAYDGEGFSPIHKAVMSGNVKLIEYLENKEVNMNCFSVATPLAIIDAKRKTIETISLNSRENNDHNDSDCSNDVDNDNPGQAQGLAPQIRYDVGNHSVATRFPNLSVQSLYCAPEKSGYPSMAIAIAPLTHAIGTEVNIQDADGRTALHYSCHENKLELVKLLIARPNLNYGLRDKDGYLAIHKAIWKGHVQCVELLLPLMKPYIDSPTSNGSTALHIACITNSIQIASMLLQAGAKVNAIDSKGDTALHKATANCNLPLIKLLVKNGADLDISNNNGISPLDFSVECDAVEIVIFLLEQGAHIPLNNSLVALFSRKYGDFLRENNKEAKPEDELPSTLVGDLKSLVNNKLYQDVIFSVNSRPIYAIKALLAVRSEYFRAMFNSSLAESSSRDNIILTDVTSECFLLVLEYIYTDTIDTTKIDLDSAISLLAAANKYMLSRLKKICERFLMKNIRLSNVSYLMQAADLYDAKELSETVMSFIADHYQKISDMNEITHIKCFTDWIVNFLKKTATACNAQTTKRLSESSSPRNSLII